MRPGEPVRDTTGTFGIRLGARTDFPEGTLMSTDDREITYVCRVSHPAATVATAA